MMDNLWKVIAEFSLELSIARIEGFAAHIETLNSTGEIEGAREFAGPNLDTRTWNSLTTALEMNPGIAPASVAAAFRTGALVGQLKDKGQEVSLAWTGPKTDFVPVRSTEQVMLEVIERAEEDIFLISFVNFGAVSIVEALNGAGGRGVGISMLLDDTNTTAGRMALAVPQAQVFIWNESSKLENGSPATASVHAKCVVADGREALITSANLTDYALEKNMELGVHLVGGREPQLLRRHLQALVDTSKILEYKR